MHYEIVNMIDPGTDNWADQKKRAQEPNGRVITLAPNPGFFGLVQSEHVKAINLVDRLTKRTYHKGSYLFFNEVPTVDGAEVFMNGDGSISIISDGDEIAQMTLYEGTRRFVKEINYTNIHGTNDYSQEYTYDGHLFSNIYYSHNEVQRMDFVDDEERPVVRFYLYQGMVNLITVEDPETHEISVRYDSMNDFIADQVSQIVKTADTTGITYMGVEIDALSKLSSRNTLYLDEPAFDDNGEVKGNLMATLEGNIPTIEEVVLDKGDYNKLVMGNFDVSRVKERVQ
ncbi:hypothetical protein ABTQ33_11440 [Paucilactobacillus suebicus]|uniref:Uncharacterized protein n=1 Tax=Paucilactobacillus suebicus DSM 5007 = KCTC 3549 TaxID=1423807 RepID=A0A0R1W3R2_9LACO|nr:hypothetical protein [Paucilactobacillus suebicus]KRM09942.1 hypothetical protein FD16_GL001482 [Paucilactobacillus suebicus DSM 5007 = KCTC 3549]